MTTQETQTDLYESRPWTKFYDPGVPTTIEYPRTTLPEFLVAGARAHPDRPAIIFFNRVMTYRELDDASSRFAAALAGLGVRKGDRVALLLPNTPQFVIGYYGTLKAGAIHVPTNPLYTASEIEHQMNDSGARVLVTLSKFFPTVQAVRHRTPLEHVVVTNIKEYFPPVLRLLFALARERKEGHRVMLPADGKTHWWQDLLKGAPARPPEVAIAPEDIALLQYTGGTTGVAKGAVLTHRNIVSNLLMLKAWLANTPRSPRGYDTIMGVLPLFHSFGMSTVMNTAIVNGGAMVLVPRFEQEQVLKAVQKYQPSLFPGVPTMYTALLNNPRTRQYSLGSIKACISGAAALPVEVKRQFEELTGAKLVEGYGLTEASPVLTANPLNGLNKAGSIGIPLPDTLIKIVDVETGTRVLPQGEIGELIASGPQIMQGYWNRPRETAEMLRDGWLYTGDIARMDEDGYFYIVDRKKDMIISGGFNVYPREVEEPLYEHPKVKEAVAVGVPDERWGELVKVFVVLKDGETATAEEIIAFCRGRMAAYKVPKEVEFRTELPKTMIGKILRRALAEEERAKRSAASSA